MPLNLDKNKKYLLACSYGPDSMFLFSLLLKENYQFDVVHVNYHLREQSNLEEESLRKFCCDFKINIFVYENSKNIIKNVEEECREIRYLFFSAIYKKNNYDGLLIAHNQDDNLETYLLQKKRKNLVFHYGLQYQSNIKGMNVIRPILEYSKSYILKYNETNKIPYAIDHTNLEDVFQRNIIRHSIVEQMSQEERSQTIFEINKLNLELRTFISKIDFKHAITYEYLKSLTSIQVAYFLFYKCRTILPDYEISYKTCQNIFTLMASSKGNLEMPIKGDIIFKKEYNIGSFEKVEPRQYKYRILIDQPCIVDNDYFYFDGLSDTSNRNINKNDYPLTVRPFENGDTYRIKDYIVKVNRLFIDWKMPLSLRAVWPIILNKDNKVIYIPRYRPDFIPKQNCNFYVKEHFSLLRRKKPL